MTIYRVERDGCGPFRGYTDYRLSRALDRRFTSKSHPDMHRPTVSYERMKDKFGYDVSIFDFVFAFVSEEAAHEYFGAHLMRMMMRRNFELKTYTKVSPRNTLVGDHGELIVKINAIYPDRKEESWVERAIKARKLAGML